MVACEDGLDSRCLDPADSAHAQAPDGQGSIHILDPNQICMRYLCTAMYSVHRPGYRTDIRLAIEAEGQSGPDPKPTIVLAVLGSRQQSCCDMSFAPQHDIACSELR